MSPWHSRQIAQARRLIGPWAERWIAAGREVRDVDGRAICISPDPRLAELIAVLHNIFLPLLNYATMLNKSYSDLVREKGNLDDPE